MARKTREKEDIERQLVEQISFLVASSRSYDQGHHAEAKRIATILRILFHETRKCRSLLGQLRLRDISWLDNSSDYDPENQASYVGLMSIRFEAGRIPWLIPRDTPESSNNTIDFDKWWSHPVIVAVAGPKKTYFSRQNIILNVADTDGGAHVDPELEDVYEELSRKNSVGYTAIKDGSRYPMLYPELPCLRQIAHEVLITLEHLAPRYFETPYPGILTTGPYGASLELGPESEVMVEIYVREKGA